MDAKVWRDKRTTASQAGRRGFDPRLPLHVFNNLQLCAINAINALSRKQYKGKDLFRCFSELS